MASDLQALINKRRRELGKTWEKMVEDAEAAGHPISRSMLIHWSKPGWTNIPPTTSLYAIAAACEVDLRTVLDAAEASLGLELRPLELDSGARAVVALLQGRSPDQVSALEVAIRAIAAAWDSGAEPDQLAGDEPDEPADG